MSRHTTVAATQVFFLLLSLVVITPWLHAQTQRESGSQQGLKGVLGDQKGKDLPLYVKSDSLSLDAKGRVFTYSGNVEIVRGDVKITCDSMRGTYSEDSKLEKILCKDNVVITRAQDMRANANRAEYDVPKSIVVLTEGPELARDGNVLSADKITIYVDEDRSEAEGSVRVKVIKAETTNSPSAIVMSDTLDESGSATAPSVAE